MSQSKVLRQFLGLIDDSTSYSLMKELFKRRRDEHYERLELEAASAQAREAQEMVPENSLWIERNPNQHQRRSSSGGDMGASSFSSHLAFADSPLSHLTDSVSSMAMYFENKIGYPHLKKALSPDEEEEEGEGEKGMKETPKSDPLAALENQFSDDEEDDEVDDEDDVIWLGTGDPSATEEEHVGGDGVSMSPEKRSSYRDRISHNIKRRTQYRESILLQFSGLDEDSGEDSSSSPSPGVTTRSASENIQSPPQPPPISSPLSSASPPPSSSMMKRLWVSLMSLLQRISSSSLSSSETLTQSIEIAPIVILAVVVYFVSSLSSEIKSGEGSAERGTGSLGKEE